MLCVHKNNHNKRQGKPVPHNRLWPASQRESHTKGHLIHKGI